MPITPAALAQLEEALNQLAMECMLAQSGTEEGMFSCFGLLSELRDLCSEEPALARPIAAVRDEMERVLDSGSPFTDAILAALRGLSSWLVDAAGQLRAGRQIAAFGASQITSSDVAAVGPTDEVMVLDLEENGDLLVEFYGEAVEHLQMIESALLALERNPDDPEALSSVFRSFHTIKGNAGFLGLAPMRTLAHEVETLLDLARNNRLTLNPVIVTEILRSRDALVDLTQQVAEAIDTRTMPSQVIPVVHLIRSIRGLAAVPGGLSPEARAATKAPFPVAVPVAPVVPMLPPAEASPAVSAPDSPGPVLDFSSAISMAFPSAAPEPVATEAVAEKAQAPASAAAAPASKPSPRSEGSAPVSGASVRVSTEKLDLLMDVVGELVIVQSQLVETARNAPENTALQRDVIQLSRLTKELQRNAMSLRMIPLRPLFQKMDRLARDLGHTLGKKVRFKMTGDETELDRTVVEEIADPLVHMVRNALDHGLESEADRMAAGKPAEGTIHLKAYHQGSSLVIELQDDGRGIDPAKIRKKANELRLVSQDAVLTREETLGLIFAPGFSTASQVTSVSGRGVGMDVVKRNIEKLRGKVEITSATGKGSTFKVRLPLTLAIIDGLVVRVGTDRFILPSSAVQMALRPTREAISSVHGAGEVLDLRGKLVPIHRLGQRFGLTACAHAPWEGILVILEISGKVSALLVDEMVSKQEVVIKNLGGYMQGLPGIAGGAVLGDGNIALILDPGSLLEAA